MTPEITAARKRYAAHLEASRNLKPAHSPYSVNGRYLDEQQMDADAHTIARDAVAAPVVQPTPEAGGLRPCPFCGSSIVGPLLESSIATDKLGVVGCGVCGANGPSLFDADELIGRWNSRWPVVQQGLEACQAALAQLEIDRGDDHSYWQGVKDAREIVTKHWPAALNDLLAIIHRDGGHHQDAVGTEQAVKEAHEILARMFHADVQPSEATELADEMDSSNSDVSRNTVSHRSANAMMKDAAAMLRKLVSAENERLRTRLLSAAGDDLCRLSQEEIKAYTSGAVKIPPKEEFISSCERFHAQIAKDAGVLEDCLTLAQLIAENTRLRAALAMSKDPCIYCQLPKERMAECKSGFPGCGRADDMTGCPEFGAAMDADQLRVTHAAMVERLLGLADRYRDLSGHRLWNQCRDAVVADLLTILAEPQAATDAAGEEPS